MALPPQSIGWRFDNTYRSLPAALYAPVAPVPVEAPRLVLLNHELAQDLGLHPGALEAAAPQQFSGNSLPSGAEPMAQAYAGHQFGHFNVLGDGRAHLLGEHLTPKGERFDIQLKGSGQTPFSRRGDGRAALGPMLREYLISEAMAALGVPTTRSLAVVATGELVRREGFLPGAILTRVASSHIRVGTFEYAASLGDERPLRALADHTLRRHYPALSEERAPYQALLGAIVDRQAALVAKWMHLGFIHGVMNTDNMALSGETIDYGPCAFMDAYSPATVFSSIDRNGRYAFGNQPRIAQWNLARLAEAMLPLLHENREQAVEMASGAVASFGAAFQGHWLRGMSLKLGLESPVESDLALSQDLLRWMESRQADYTNTFRALSLGRGPGIPEDEAFRQWRQRWAERRPSLGLMQQHNPAIIPRNHLVEAALAAAVSGDLVPLERLLQVLKKPFEESSAHGGYQDPAPATSAPYQTFCGT